MKYFEVHNPYYALVKAKSKEKAKDLYIEMVADDAEDLEDHIREVGRGYALLRFGTAPSEAGETLAIPEALKEFQADEGSMLLIDGSFL